MFIEFIECLLYSLLLSAVSINSITVFYEESEAQGKCSQGHGLIRSKAGQRHLGSIEWGTSVERGTLNRMLPSRHSLRS